MRRYVLLILVFVVLCILAASAHAQTYYRFEVYGSANIPSEKGFQIGMPQSTTPLDGKLHLSPGLRGGVRFGVDGLHHWGQDITYSYGTNAAKIRVNQNGEFAFTSRTHQFAYNAIFYPAGTGHARLIPYITAGAGGTIFTVSQKSINEAFFEGLGKLQNHVSFTFNAGGGVRIQFTDNVGIRLDVRDWMSHPPRYGIPESSSDPQRFVFPVNGVFHQVEASVAFVYCFRNSH
jgi:opacity protein-like surface antigen